MKPRSNLIRIAAAALALWFVIIGCGLTNRITEVGETQTETQTIELGAAEDARVKIEMAAGELTVEGGASNLMDADFRYNVADWKPTVSYSVDGGHGELVVSQNGENFPIGDEVINEWKIRLYNAIPLDLEIATGAGIGVLDLSQVDLTNLKVDMGAGTTDLNLGGSWDHDVTARVSGGAGELKITLPADMGVRVEANTGVGNLTVNGLERDGDEYVNSLLGSAEHTLTLDVDAGVGAITLDAP